MNQGGFDRHLLERMTSTLQGYIDRKEMPGMVAYLSRGDESYVQTFGTLDFDDPTPMAINTPFRIASLTKIVTAVAGMILIEDCAMQLGDPIERWIPEMADRRVLKRIDAPIDETVPAERPITVRDVFTYRFGLGSIMAPPDRYPIQKEIAALQIGGDGPKLPTDRPGVDEWLQRLGSLPLVAQPGTQWMYDVSGDLLGALIARVSGGTLGEFIHKRIFAPLGMTRSGFRLPRALEGSLPGIFQTDRDGVGLSPFEDRKRSAWSAQEIFESGGGGLLSTVEDFARFMEMLRNGGRLDGVRILSRTAIDLMTTDALTPENRKGQEIFFGDFASWGLGFAVDIARREMYQNPGKYGWTGGFGTTAYNDPAEDLTGILFTQRMMDSPEGPRFFSDFWTLAYAALE